MMGRHFGCTAALILISLLGYGQGMRAQSVAPASLAALKQSFISPPEDARVMMRWWWFGPGVSQPELEREIRMMKEGGIGGFEIQPVYPLELDDPDKDFRNLGYLSDEFLIALRFANQKGKELGMRVDITLGSGWPFGGPHIPVTDAAAKLRMRPGPRLGRELREGNTCHIHPVAHRSASSFRIHGGQRPVPSSSLLWLLSG